MRARLVSVTLLSLLITMGLETSASESPASVSTHDDSTRARALGPWAVDEHGQGGRIHTVESGDTLWDISAAYLGTPWVWPSVWNENDGIADPHLIRPGDRIWITAGEMRKITREQADQMILAGRSRAAEVSEHVEPERVPEPPAPLPPQNVVRVAEREVMGFVSSAAVRAATSIVDSPSPRGWLAEGDLVYLGMGVGQVAVGDEFTLFRDADPIRDVGGGELLGYHVNILGWLVVREVVGESSVAEIRSSRSEIERGDRMIPRQHLAREIAIKATGRGVEGNIVYMPDDRSHVADGDYVYINRGANHGFIPGSEVEVYTPGVVGWDRVRAREVDTPDEVQARLVLVAVESRTSVGFVISARHPLEVGDLIRPVAPRVVRR